MVHFIWLRLVCMIHPQRGVCSPTHRPRLIDWLIDWLIERLIDWEIERFMHITYGSNLSEFVFSSYNIRWLHHLNTSSVYIIPLRYRRSSLTAAVRPSFYTLDLHVLRDSPATRGMPSNGRTDIDWLRDLCILPTVVISQSSCFNPIIFSDYITLTHPPSISYLFAIAGLVLRRGVRPFVLHHVVWTFFIPLISTFREI